jgi:hypothetical protein
MGHLPHLQRFFHEHLSQSPNLRNSESGVLPNQHQISIKLCAGSKLTKIRRYDGLLLLQLEKWDVNITCLTFMVISPDGNQT